jgi:hypothetical protein
MTATTLAKVRGGMLAVGMCASLAVGLLGFTGSAEARVRGPRTSESAQICGWIQDEYDKNLAKRNTFKPGSREWNLYNDKMINLNQAWGEQDCKGSYGNIASRVEPIADVAGADVEVQPFTPAPIKVTAGQAGGVLQAMN